MDNYAAWREDEPIVIDPSLWDLRELDDMVMELNALQEAQRQIAEWESHLKDAIAKALGEKGAIRYGDYVYRFAHTSTEKCIDPDGFIEWMESDDGAQYRRKLFNPTYARKSVLPQAVRDTFFAKEYSELRTLQAVPIDKAPKYLQKLEEGESHVKQ